MELPTFISPCADPDCSRASRVRNFEEKPDDFEEHNPPEQPVDGDDVSLWWSAADSPVEIKNRSAFISSTEHLRFTDALDDLEGSWLQVLLFAMDVEYHACPHDDNELPPQPETIVDLVKLYRDGAVFPADFIAAAVRSSCGAVTGRFFPVRSSMNLSLDRMLAYWLRQGSVPVLCVNVPLEDDLDEGWQYFVVFKVENGRIDFMMPSGFSQTLDAGHLWKYLDDSFVQYACPNGLLGRRGISFENMHELKDIGDGINVLGQIAYALETKRDHQAHYGSLEGLSCRATKNHTDSANTDAEFINKMFSEGSSSCFSYDRESRVDSIRLPSQMEGGILLFSRTDQDKLCTMINDIREPLCDPKF
ncbi:uncharacterized protein LOC129586988 [Paramacrobiotus metropolitanus]|uniref:uncharacterized protein LOC129586988 n=1 Tax=Paramacrobiotus metropolitanus TaxID=2943436 RepID=UPI0024458434|nr:uncharacterized protein LOC129586988 [Paramacrobiotus metropolitanus]